MDHSNQPLYSCWSFSYLRQYDNPLFLWNLRVQTNWGEQIYSNLLSWRYSGECRLYASGRSLFNSYWGLRGRFCRRRSFNNAAPKAKSICVPHTGTPASLGSRHWDFLFNLTFPKCSVAGAPWRFIGWTSSRLYFQKKATLFLLVVFNI